MDADRIAAAALAVALAASAVHAGEVGRASVTSAGTQGNSASFSAGNRTLSADARLVVFQSTASDLVAGDTNGVEDVFVHDRTTGATVRASLTKRRRPGHAGVPQLDRLARRQDRGVRQHGA
jgi:hypothetical protein